MATPLRCCRACQRQALDTFASLTGLQINTLPSRALSPRHIQSSISQPFKRSLYTSIPRYRSIQNDETSDSLLQNDSTSETTLNSASASTPSPSQPQPASESQHIPWYLQVAPPTPIRTAPPSLAQDLPDVPPDAPTILPSILNHLSITIGLDNLALLDLRNLNPPSPLGANLLMVIGTARSERHLNNSADRFCRWVRSTYKLRPYADGLLGRNELKLKLRRRNRKLKLAQSVGSTIEYDDGITTGWICCNLGAVDGAIIPESEDEVHEEIEEKDQERFLEGEDEYRNPSEESLEEFKYRGFGSASSAPRIVVQMFVESKRVEMDLEGLWEARIKRREATAEKRADEDDFETSRIEAELGSPVMGVGRRASRV